jgi:hypothetical protein
MTRALADLQEDDPITLTEASELVLRGAVTVSTLRAEVRRGNLAVERIGKNLFTTPAYIKQMRERCRVQQSHRDSTSARNGMEAKAGSSGTATATDELAALKATATALKNGSLNTSRKSTRQSHPRAADPIPFPSRR